MDTSTATSSYAAFVPLLMAIAASGGIIYYFKAIPEYFWMRIKKKVLYTVRVYQYDELFQILERYFCQYYNEQYRDVEVTLEKEESSEGDEKKTLRYKQEDNSFIMRYKGRRIVVSKSKEKLEKAENPKDLYFRKFIISGFFAKNQIDMLLKEALKYSLSQENKDTVKVFSNTSWGDWAGPKIVRVKPVDKVILNPKLKELLLNDINEFSTAEKWYLDTSIPYKRGYGFYGPPGTGKTTLALSLAAYTKRKVYSINMTCIPDDSRLVHAFSEIRGASILLLEDIDAIFNGRESVNKESKISFSTLLNCIDGAFYKHGLITIVTTNHIEKLDPALLRTGRLDMKVEVPRPGVDEIESYLKVFYERDLKLDDWNIEGITMSDVQEICLNNKKDFNKTLEDLYKWSQ